MVEQTIEKMEEHYNISIAGFIDKLSPDDKAALIHVVEVHDEFCAECRYRLETKSCANRQNKVFGFKNVSSASEKKTDDENGNKQTPDKNVIEDEDSLSKLDEDENVKSDSYSDTEKKNTNVHAAKENIANSDTQMYIIAQSSSLTENDTPLQIDDSHETQTEENSNVIPDEMDYRQDCEDIEQQQNSILMDSSNSTLKTTRWSIHMFKNWLLKNGVNQDFEHFGVHRILEYLTKMAATSINKNGSFYSEKTMKLIRSCILRYLNGFPYNRNISGKFFKIPESTYKKPKESVDDVERFRQISQTDIKKLYASGVFGNGDSVSPRSLLHKVWFEINYHFGPYIRRACWKIQREELKMATDESGILFCTICLKDTPSSQWIFAPRIYSEPQNPFCPLKSILLYISHLNQNNDLLFQQPTKYRFQDFNGEWYTGKPLGKSTVKTLMKVISDAASLSKIYPNISIRETALYVLEAEGLLKEINERKIMRCRLEFDTSEKKRQIFGTLQNYLHGTLDTASTSDSHKTHSVGNQSLPELMSECCQDVIGSNSKPGNMSLKTEPYVEESQSVLLNTLPLKTESNQAHEDKSLQSTYRKLVFPCNIYDEENHRSIVDLRNHVDPHQPIVKNISISPGNITVPKRRNDSLEDVDKDNDTDARKHEKGNKTSGENVVYIRIESKDANVINEKNDAKCKNTVIPVKYIPVPDAKTSNSQVSCRDPILFNPPCTSTDKLHGHGRNINMSAKPVKISQYNTGLKDESTKGKDDRHPRKIIIQYDKGLTEEDTKLKSNMEPHKIIIKIPPDVDSKKLEIGKYNQKDSKTCMVVPMVRNQMPSSESEKNSTSKRDNSQTQLPISQQTSTSGKIDQSTSKSRTFVFVNKNGQKSVKTKDKVEVNNKVLDHHTVRIEETRVSVAAEVTQSVSVQSSRVMPEIQTYTEENYVTSGKPAVKIINVPNRNDSLNLDLKNNCRTLYSNGNCESEMKTVSNECLAPVIAFDAQSQKWVVHNMKKFITNAQPFRTSSKGNKIVNEDINGNVIDDTGFKLSSTNSGSNKNIFKQAYSQCNTTSSTVLMHNCLVSKQRASDTDVKQENICRNGVSMSVHQKETPTVIERGDKECLEDWNDKSDATESEENTCNFIITDVKSIASEENFEYEQNQAKIQIHNGETSTQATNLPENILKFQEKFSSRRQKIAEILKKIQDDNRQVEILRSKRHIGENFASCIRQTENEEYKTKESQLESNPSLCDHTNIEGECTEPMEENDSQIFETDKDSNNFGEVALPSKSKHRKKFVFKKSKSRYSDDQEVRVSVLDINDDSKGLDSSNGSFDISVEAEHQLKSTPLKMAFRKKHGNRYEIVKKGTVSEQAFYSPLFSEDCCTSGNLNLEKENIDNSSEKRKRKNPKGLDQIENMKVDSKCKRDISTAYINEVLPFKKRILSSDYKINDFIDEEESISDSSLTDESSLMRCINGQQFTFSDF